MLFDDTLDECVQCRHEIIALALKLVCELLELIGDNRVQHDVRAGDVELRAEASELELVAGESERGGSVSVRCILCEGRQNVYANLHVDAECAAVDRAGLNGVQDSCKLVAEEDGDDGRRRFVCAEAMIVACGSDGDTQQILILVNTLDNSGEEQEKLCIFLRQLARLKQILAGIGGK